MRAIPLFDHAHLSPDAHSALTDAIQPLKTLADVLAWTRSSTPTWVVAEIVTQDEYTHDVVLASPGQPYLAFDTT
jgi:hypothetical protein